MKNRFFALWGILLPLAVSCAAGEATTGVAAQWAAVERQRSQLREAMSPSLEKQMASVRKQLNIAGDPKGFFVLASSLPAPSEPDCDPVSPLILQGMAKKAASASHISTDLILAVIHQESDSRPCATSPKGAMGLMQLMPDTAAALGVADAFDPEQNVSAGAKLLRKLLDRYAGDLNRVLGAYNAGSGNVDAYGGVPPFPETESYVDSIMRALDSSRREH
jgi:soluble lytic murein transglycosylase-like protein